MPPSYRARRPAQPDRPKNKKNGSENLLRGFDGGARLWVVLACSKLQVKRVIELSKAVSKAVALEGGARRWLALACKLQAKRAVKRVSLRYVPQPVYYK